MGSIISAAAAAGITGARVVATGAVVGAAFGLAAVAAVATCALTVHGLMAVHGHFQKRHQLSSAE